MNKTPSTRQRKIQNKVLKAGMRTNWFRSGRAAQSIFRAQGEIKTKISASPNVKVVAFCFYFAYDALEV